MCLRGTSKLLFFCNILHGPHVKMGKKCSIAVLTVADVSKNSPESS